MTPFEEYAAAFPMTVVKNAEGHVVEPTAGPCIWCFRHVELGRFEAGATLPDDPAWQNDGDFGCIESPETLSGEDEPNAGVGDHARPWDLALWLMVRRPELLALREQTPGGVGEKS